MSDDILLGDYECDECGGTKHDPESKVCPNCGGEMVYMMTEHDEIEVLRAENAKLLEALKAIVGISRTAISNHNDPA